MHYIHVTKTCNTTVIKERKKEEKKKKKEMDHSVFIPGLRFACRSLRRRSTWKGGGFFFFFCKDSAIYKNNNGYLERLNSTGPKSLHIL